MCSQTACLKGSSLQHANTCTHTHTHTHNPHQNTCQCRNQTNLLKGSYTTQHVHNFFETTQPNQANHQPYPIVLYYVHRASPIMAKPTHPATNTQTHTHMNIQRSPNHGVGKLLLSTIHMQLNATQLKPIGVDLSTHTLCHRYRAGESEPNMHTLFMGNNIQTILIHCTITKIMQPQRRMRRSSHNLQLQTTMGPTMHTPRPLCSQEPVVLQHILYIHLYLNMSPLDLQTLGCKTETNKAQPAGQ